MSALPQVPSPPSAAKLIAPTAEQWKALSAEQRERLITQYNMGLSAQTDLLPEGRPHSRAKSKALDKLNQYFSRVGRRIYLADELAVHYPGQPVFAPDILAVLDVEDPGDEDTRTAWVVQDEGKGLDLVLEIYYGGGWTKDFVDNVDGYARLGISEYFIYDRRHQLLTGYRLSGPSSQKYQKIRSRFGRCASQILGLDLAVAEGRLRFFHGSAELFDSAELIGQLDRMVDDLQRRQEQAEQDRLQAEQDRLQAEQDRLQAEQQVTELLSRMRQTVVDILVARKIPVSEEMRAQLSACQDSQVLAQWLVRAAVASAAAEVLSPSSEQPTA